MKKILFLLIYLTGTFLLQSCSDEGINTEPPQFVTDNVIYTHNGRILQMVNNLYTFLPRGYNRLDSDPSDNDKVDGYVPVGPGAGILTAMVASATDEAVHATRNSAAEKWGRGFWGTAPTNAFDNPIKTLYTGIRRTYEYTEGIHPNIIPGPVAPQLTATQRDQYYGQVIFLRALFNFELLKRFGGYPIVTNALAANGNLSIPKSSYDECVQYIAALCDEAQAVLPVTYAASDLGRATKGAALALKGRLLLYAASPLNNPGAVVSKWEAAAEANAAVINLKDGAAKVYNLYTAGTGYDAFFFTLAANPEIILSRIEAASFTYERLNGLPSIPGGLGGTNPTWDLVSAYEMSNGTPFDWNNPTHRNNPFANRDPRFAKSILYNGVTNWQGTGSTFTVETFEGAKDKAVVNATRTGFYLRKFMGSTVKWNTPTATANHSWPIIRYGETLLNYAEAMNEAYGPDSDPKTYGMTARRAIELIRERAGLTGNRTVPSATTKELMREAIRHERRIELAFEEHRHLDLRRWKIAETVLNQPVSGLKIVKTGTTFNYTPEIVEERVFTEKMYRYPFPQEEISRNPSLIQNPGW